MFRPARTRPEVNLVRDERLEKVSYVNNAGIRTAEYHHPEQVE